MFATVSGMDVPAVPFGTLTSIALKRTIIFVHKSRMYTHRQVNFYGPAGVSEGENAKMTNAQLTQEWKELLCQLDGVLSAHVVFSELGVPEEVHVLATTQKRPKAIARDVQSALISRFGTDIDHHIISVAQIQPEMMERLDSRLVFTGVQIRVEGVNVVATVMLKRGGREVEGSASGTNLQYTRRRCVAMATLDAITKCTQLIFELAGVESVPLFGSEVVVSQVFSPADGRCLVGSSVSEADQDVAVVQSVLGAVNRRVALASPMFQ